MQRRLLRLLRRQPKGKAVPIKNKKAITLEVTGRERSEITVGRNLFGRIASDLKGEGIKSKIAIIADANLKGMGERLKQALSVRGLSACLVTVPAGENAKTLETFGKVSIRLKDEGIDRKSKIIVLGGGAASDLAGFVAATYMRGIPAIYVPTTVLSMVDAAIGGKTAIDIGGVKNLVGAFRQPEKVYMDVDALRTLPQREYMSGFGEIVKHGVIADAKFFSYLEQNIEAILGRNPLVLERIIRKNALIKAGVVGKDPKEENLRAILNYGHTAGHAIEMLSKGRLLHGEAVSIGMCIAAEIAKNRGILSSPKDAQRQKELLKRLGLPTTSPKDMPAKGMLAKMASDKKAEAGKIRFVLPEKIGKIKSENGAYALPVSEKEIKKALAALV